MNSHLSSFDRPHLVSLIFRDSAYLKHHWEESPAIFIVWRHSRRSHGSQPWLIASWLPPFIQDFGSFSDEMACLTIIHSVHDQLALFLQQCKSCHHSGSPPGHKRVVDSTMYPNYSLLCENGMLKVDDFTGQRSSSGRDTSCHLSTSKFSSIFRQRASLIHIFLAEKETLNTPNHRAEPCTTQCWRRVWRKCFRNCYTKLVLLDIFRRRYQG